MKNAFHSSFLHPELRYEYVKFYLGDVLRRGGTVFVYFFSADIFNDEKKKYSLLFFEKIIHCGEVKSDHLIFVRFRIGRLMFSFATTADKLLCASRSLKSYYRVITFQSERDRETRAMKRQ